MRGFIRQFLLYSRSERRAVIVLVMLIVAVIITPKMYHFYVSRSVNTKTDTTLEHDIAVWQKESDIKTDTTEQVNTVAVSVPQASDSKLHYFDPNIIGIADWQKMGLSEKQAASIEKYKAKGGVFRKPDDLRKIYVLSDKEKDRLVPYVRIGNSSAGGKAKQYASYMIEINTADSAAFESLWGIGPVLSHGIVKYRTLLGGFTRVDQVGEVHGIRDSVFMSIRPHLKVDPTLIRKLNINEADYETLRKHPYIHAKIARVIVGYRDNNGKFTDLKQLKQYKAVTDDIYVKIMPYLTL